MIRLVFYIALSLALTLGLAWLLATPGTIQIDLAGYRMQPGIGLSAIILIGVILASIVIWSLVARLISTPRVLARRAAAAKQKKGVDALSEGFIALQAGEAERARQLARQARSRLPDNAAAHLLEARAELALGEWGTAREQYRALIDNPETALAALSGLYEQANAQKREDAALTFAQKALALAPSLPWASEAVFMDIVRRGDWAAGLQMVRDTPAASRSEKEKKKRQQAVLYSAIALTDETSDPMNALDKARMALKLEPNFVPAALIAARIYSSRGEVRKATSLLRRVWRATKHPHVGALYASAQPGISPTERLKRITDLIPEPPPDKNSALVLAQTAIEAGEWSRARNALAKFASTNPSQGVCVAMARIEEGQDNDYGKARQWLARAVTAPRDPVWTADGVTAEEWAPVSPITGALDAFEWRVPTSAVALSDDAELSGFEDQGLSGTNDKGKARSVEGVENVEDATLLSAEAAPGEGDEAQGKEGVKPGPAIEQKSSGD